MPGFPAISIIIFFELFSYLLPITHQRAACFREFIFYRNGLDKEGRKGGRKLRFTGSGEKIRGRIGVEMEP